MKMLVSNISLTLQQWTALDVMADEDGLTAPAMVAKLITEEAARRLRESPKRGQAEKEGR